MGAERERVCVKSIERARARKQESKRATERQTEREGRETATATERARAREKGTEEDMLEKETIYGIGYRISQPYFYF